MTCCSSMTAKELAKAIRESLSRAHELICEATSRGLRVEFQEKELRPVWVCYVYPDDPKFDASKIKIERNIKEVF